MRFKPAVFAALMTLRCCMARWPISLDETSIRVSTAARTARTGGRLVSGLTCWFDRARCRPANRLHRGAESQIRAQPVAGHRNRAHRIAAQQRIDLNTFHARQFRQIQKRNEMTRGRNGHAVVGMIPDAQDVTRRADELIEQRARGGSRWPSSRQARVAERVDCHVDLRALLAFAAVIAGSLAALERGSQRPAVDDRGARLRLATRRQPQHRAQVVDQRLEVSRRQPALRLLVYCRPRQQVVGHPPPWRARLHDTTQAVDHLAQIMLLLTGIPPDTKPLDAENRSIWLRPDYIGASASAVDNVLGACD